jgi:hypothetical protein
MSSSMPHSSVPCEERAGEGIWGGARGEGLLDWGGARGCWIGEGRGVAGLVRGQRVCGACAHRLPNSLPVHGATHAADLEEAARAPGGVPRVAHQPVVDAALSAPADDADGVAAQGLAGGGARVDTGGVAARADRGEGTPRR